MSLSIGSKWMSTFTLNEYVITEVEKKWLGTSMVYLRADGDFEDTEVCLNYLENVYFPLIKTGLNPEVGSWHKGASFPWHRVCVKSNDGSNVEYFWRDKHGGVRTRKIDIDWFLKHFEKSYHINNIALGSKWVHKKLHYIIEVTTVSDYETGYFMLGVDGEFVLANSLFLREFAPRP